MWTMKGLKRRHMLFLLTQSLSLEQCSGTLCLILMNLPSLQNLYASRTLKHAEKIVADPSHPGRKLFGSLPSGSGLWSISTKTSRHKNSFGPTAAGLINQARDPHWQWLLPPSPPYSLHIWINQCVTLTHIIWTVPCTLQIFFQLNTVNFCTSMANIFAHSCTNCTVLPFK